MFSVAPNLFLCSQLAGSGYRFVPGKNEVQRSVLQAVEQVLNPEMAIIFLIACLYHSNGYVCMI
jgi:hypothetical protein